jgi:RecA-family ATPase
VDKPFWIKTDPTQWSTVEAALEREKARMAREMEWDGLFHRHQPHSSGEPLEHNWIIENFLPREYDMLLGGPPDAGKGCFTTALAKAVAKGDDFAGMKTTKGPVLWVAMEECYGERKELFNHDPEFLKEEIDIWTCYLRHAPIDTDEGFESLKYWARKTNANLIVIDPLYAAVSNCNLSEGHYARRAMQRLKHLAYEMNCAIIVLHQVNRGKAHRIADSIQLQATASINAVFSRSPAPPPPAPGGEGAGGGGASACAESLSRVTIRTTGRGMFANATRYF